jgi:GTP-binding protein
MHEPSSSDKPAARRPDRDAGPNFDSARYAVSVAQIDQLNEAALPMLPEVALVGRSNAGKSSIINALTRQRQLAYASKTPGRTQLLNFFTVSRRAADGSIEPCVHLVDLPGYGFARVDDATRERWDQLVGRYLQTRRMLAMVVLVADGRRGLTPADEELIGWLLGRERPRATHLHILLNKSDQLKTAERRAALLQAETRAHELPMPVSVQLASALNPSGIDELRDTIGYALRNARV